MISIKTWRFNSGLKSTSHAAFLRLFQNNSGRTRNWKIVILMVLFCIWNISHPYAGCWYVDCSSVVSSLYHLYPSPSSTSKLGNAREAWLCPVELVVKTSTIFTIFATEQIYSASLYAKINIPENGVLVFKYILTITKDLQIFYLIAHILWDDSAVVTSLSVMRFFIYVNNDTKVQIILKLFNIYSIENAQTHLR